MPKTVRIFAAGLALVWMILPLPTEAATVTNPDDWCGTDPSVRTIVTAQHQQLERQRSRERLFKTQTGPLLQPASKPQVSQEGDVVIVVDDGSIIRPPNESDVANKGFRLQFKKKKGYKVSRKSSSISGSLGQRIVLGDDDSVLVPFEKGFKFKFFGQTYSRMYVNSDGNITFGEGDSASSARDLGRAISGPPRIMAYFTDLDPSVAGNVYVKFLGKGKMQVTWEGVPIFGGFSPNTFQVTLSRKGHVEFRFREIDAASGIIGFSPGVGSSLRLLDFTEDSPITVPAQSIAEVFGDEEIVDETLLSKIFYENYPDDVHQISVFYDFPLQLLGGGAVAYHFTTKNQIRGIGYKNRPPFRDTFDFSSSMGSDGVLEGFANMGYVHKYNDNLNRRRQTLTHLGVFIHEIGHQWLSRLFYRKGGTTSGELQENGGHWAFHTHSSASFMQGNDIEDLGGGDFRTRETDAIFSELDLYVLGVIPPGQVGDFFYVAESGQDPRRLPEFNFNMRGRRVDVSIDDVIRHEGARDPDHNDSARVTRVAMILLVKQGAAPQQRSIDKVQDFVRLGAREWSNQTDGVLSLDFSLVPN